LWWCLGAAADGPEGWRRKFGFVFLVVKTGIEYKASLGGDGCCGLQMIVEAG